MVGPQSMKVHNMTKLGAKSLQSRGDLSPSLWSERLA
jgi:hypothetical protein